MLGGWIRFEKADEDKCPRPDRGISIGERLRNGRRRGAIVLVRIVNVVRVELHLVVVEVEVRRVVNWPSPSEYCSCPSRHRTSDRGYFPLNREPSISSRSCILFGSSPASLRGTRTRQRQAVSPQCSTLRKTVIVRTLAVSLY